MKKIKKVEKKKSEKITVKREKLRETDLVQERDHHFHIRVPQAFKAAVTRLSKIVRKEKNYGDALSDASLIIKLVREELTRRKGFDK